MPLARSCAQLKCQFLGARANARGGAPRAMRSTARGAWPIPIMPDTVPSALAMGVEAFMHAEAGRASTHPLCHGAVGWRGATISSCRRATPYFCMPRRGADLNPAISKVFLTVTVNFQISGFELDGSGSRSGPHSGSRTPPVTPRAPWMACPRHASGTQRCKQRVY